MPIGLLRFLIHGIPEVAAYLLFAMAGGITSLAFISFIKGKLSKDDMLNVVRRASYIAIGGVIALILAALIEVFLINHFFG